MLGIARRPFVINPTPQLQKIASERRWPVYFPDSVRAEIMRLHEKLEPRPHETRVQELSRERKSENRQLERLAALLAKKADPATANVPDDKAA